MKHKFIKIKVSSKDKIKTTLGAWRQKYQDFKIKKQSHYLHLSRHQRFKKWLLYWPFSFLYLWTSKEGYYTIFKFCFTCFLIGILVSTGLYFYYRGEVPATVAELQDCIHGQPTHFYDHSGQHLLWTYRDGDECQAIQLDQVNQDFIDALILSEDEDFYKHGGYKITAIARATFNTLRGRRQGGSTITQQYIKNAVLKDATRNLSRKIKEIVIAPEIESRYTKDEILTAYINTASFGSIYSGVQAASWGYFNKPASDLSLAEAISLVAFLPAPNYLLNHPEEHQIRRQRILQKMLQKNKITKTEYQQARQSKITFNKSLNSRAIKQAKAPHFVLQAKKQMSQILCRDVEDQAACLEKPSQGYTVKTTLNLKIQALIQDAIRQTVVDSTYNNAGLIAIDAKNGWALGLQGSLDFNQPQFGQFDVINQPQAAYNLIHPLVYAALLEQDTQFSGGRWLYDYPTFKFLPEENYEGPLTLRQALQQSRPTPTAKVAYLVGQPTMVDFGQKLGLDNWCQKCTHLDYAHGGNINIKLSQLTNAYATFGRLGQHQDLTYIQSILDSKKRPIYSWQDGTKKVLDGAQAYMMNDILSQRGEAWETPLTVATQTGHNAKFLNNHIIAYTPQISLGGFIGDYSLKGKFNAEMSESAKTNLINNFLRNYPIQESQPLTWSKPHDLKTLDIINVHQVRSGDQITDFAAPQIQIDKIKSGAVFKIDPRKNQLVHFCAPESKTKTVTIKNIIPEIQPENPAYLNWMIPIIKALNIDLPTTISQEYQCF